RLLQEELAQPGRANALLAAGDSGKLASGLKAHLTLDDWGLLLLDPESRTDRLFTRLGGRKARKLNELKESQWRELSPEALAARADPDTKIVKRQAVLEYYRQRAYLSLESRQLIVEPFVEPAAKQAAREAGLREAPTFIYLANRIEEGGKELSYMAIAAL